MKKEKAEPCHRTATYINQKQWWEEHLRQQPDPELRTRKPRASQGQGWGARAAAGHGDGAATAQAPRARTGCDASSAETGPRKG